MKTAADGLYRFGPCAVRLRRVNIETEAFCKQSKTRATVLRDTARVVG